jgi:hypothetical protein
MQKHRLKPHLLLIFALLGFVAGCGNPRPIPSDITLRQALEEVKDGIQLLQERKVGEKPAGLLISEVQVSFNITANAKDTSKLGLDLAPGGVIKEIPTGVFEKTTETGLTRGNQISFKFQNLFLANKDTIVGISVTPTPTTSETTTTTGKDSKSSTEKNSGTTQSLTLEQLFQFLDKTLIIKSQ